MEKERNALEKVSHLENIHDVEMLHDEITKITKDIEISQMDSSYMKHLVTVYSSLTKNLLVNSGVNIGPISEYEREFINTVYDRKIMRKIKELIFLVYKQCYDNLYSELNPAQDLNSKVILFIEQNYQNQRLGLQMIADEFCMSKDYIGRNFKSRQNMKINDYINLIRVNEAKKCLSETDELISRISRIVGFSNYRTFVRIFTSVTGTSPKHYRNNKNEGNIFDNKEGEK